MAYTPGTGNVFTENFNDGDDEGWDSGLGGTVSRWGIDYFNGSMDYSADGCADRGKPPLHASMHLIHPIPSVTSSVAFYLYSQGGSGFYFYLDLEQRGCTKRLYRLQIKDDGSLEFWAADGSGSPIFLLTKSAANKFKFNTNQWIRFAIEGTSYPVLKARVWGGSAQSEPSTWMLEYADTTYMVERISKMTIGTESPCLNFTYIDDMDLFGDKSKGVISSIKTIYIMELSHLDIGFTEPPDEIEQFCKTHLDQVIQNLKADPAYMWNIESVWQLERWIDRSTQAQIDEMFDFIRQGRIAVMGGYANLQSHGNGYEEQIRTLYPGLRMAREQNFQIKTYLQDDVPGNTFAIPEILSKSGLKYYIGGMNCSFGGKTNHPDHTERPFYWIGPDGSRLLTWFTFDGYAEAFNYGFGFFDNINTLFQKLGETLPKNEEECYPYDTLLLMRGFDNHYQGLFVKNLIDQWNSTYQTPKFILCHPDQFLEKMIEIIGPENIPAFAGDWGNAWGTGGPIQAHATANNRKAHRNAREGEAFAAVSDAYGLAPNPTSDIRFMYRRILEYDEHSGGGAGWPEYFTPEETERNNRIHQGYAQDARNTAEKVLNDSVDAVASNIPATIDSIVVFNPLAWTRTGWVRTQLPPEIFGKSFKLIDSSSSSEIPYQRFEDTSSILFRASDVPSVGYKVFRIEDGTPVSPSGGFLSASGNVVENDYYRITISTTDGSISSLYDKTASRELVNASSAFKFNGAAYTTHSTHFFGGESTREDPSSAAVTVKLNGPLAASLLVTRTGTPQTESEITLYRWHNLIDIRNVFDKNEMPYVNYDTASNIWAATFPFDIHNFNLRAESPTRFLDPPNDQFDRSTVFPHQNVEHSIVFWDDFIGVISASPEASVEDFERMANTAASFPRNNAAIFHRVKVRSDEAKFEDGTIGPYEDEPDTSPLYTIHHYFKTQSSGFSGMESAKFGAENCSEMPARIIQPQEGSFPSDRRSFFSVDAPNAYLYTIKKADDGNGYLLRLLEHDGVSTTARIDSSLVLTNPLKVDFAENGGEALAMEEGKIVVQLSPYETVTIRVQASPPGPIDLLASKAPEIDAVHLYWSGGKAPFTVRRSTSNDFSTDVVTLASGMYDNSYDDIGALSDGNDYYYRVEGIQ
ncbi:MAG: glycoside hydrolase family 38 C-terminal domain-containing protein [Acidobacteriota bacterium]